MAAPALLTAAVLFLCFCVTPRVARAESRGDCKSQTVTVSTLPIMRHNDVALRGLDAHDAPAAASDSRLFLSIRHDLPGELSIADDLENTELPYFVLEISGPALELGSVHWHQRWLENGTLHFHVLQESVALRLAAAAAGAATAGPDNLPTIPQRHVLHVSIMGGLIALLILLLLLTLALYNRRGGAGSTCCLPASARHRPPMPPQKSASAEAGDEIHYIPSVLLGSHGLDSRRSNTRLLQDSHADADGTPVRETPILDDFDFENGLGMGTGSRAVLRGGGGDEDYGSQVTRTLESLGRTEHDGSARSDISPGRDETVESLVLKFKESFRGSSPLEMNRLQQTPTPSISSGRHKRHRHSRSRGSPRSPISKTTLALLSVTSCFLAVACGMHVACPLTVRVTLHVPEHFVADGSVLVLSDAGRLDVGGWLNPARVLLFRQSFNASLPWLRDPCSERTLDRCEHLCEPDTGECSCKIGYQPDPVHPHLCLRHDWEPNQGPWPYTTFERGYDLVTGEQPSDKIFRFTYGMGRGLWLPYSKSLVVPPMELDVSPLAGCRTDLSVTEEPAQVREEALRSTHFESLEDLLDSFGPVRDCSRDNGGCTRNYHCVSERRVDSTGCVCPIGLRPMKDGSGCYDYRQGVDCSDGQNGGCEQLCLQQTVPMPDDTTTYNIHMFCSCVEEYRLGPDQRSCLLLSEPCPGGALCSDHDQHGPGDVMFWEMLHGFDNGTGPTFTQEVAQNLSEVLGNGTDIESLARGQIFRVSFRERNVIQGLPQLPDGIQVTFLPTDQQCQVHLSDPVADRKQLEGQVNYSEVLGYPIVQQWTLRSNLHHVSLGARNLSPGFLRAASSLSSESSRQEFLALLGTFGRWFSAEALYGYETKCTLHFSSKRIQRHTWLQYQKLSKVTYDPMRQARQGGEEKLPSFAAFVASLSEDKSGAQTVSIECNDLGQCPTSCDQCLETGKSGPNPTPVLLEILKAVPVCHLLQDNYTQELCRRALLSTTWCSGKGDVVDNWCRCDVDAFDSNGLPGCAPLPLPSLHLSAALEPTSTLVAFEWEDLEQPIGSKIIDYLIQYDALGEAGAGPDTHWENQLSFLDDLLLGPRSPCVSIGRNVKSGPTPGVFTLIFKCLEPDTLYKFSLQTVDSTGRRSEPSNLHMRTPCKVVDDIKGEEIADKLYNLFNGYTSGKEQQLAYSMLLDTTAAALHRIRHHYNTHYSKFGDFNWRLEDELGPRKGSIIFHQMTSVSPRCAELLAEPSVYTHTVSIPYLVCHEGAWAPHGLRRPADLLRVCDERWLSVLRNYYADNSEG
uniref:astrotactin-2-like isoform X2 n=1 Tax=Myxine glutinosa TaxID=7769 RepID=UPI00358FD0EB